MPLENFFRPRSVAVLGDGAISAHVFANLTTESFGGIVTRTLDPVPGLAILPTPDLIPECARRGVPAAILLGDATPDQIGARRSMRVLGGSSFGVVYPPAHLNASVGPRLPRRGTVALLSQSSGICSALLDWASERHIGFSCVIDLGTMLDVDFADLLDHLADDSSTHSIVLYMDRSGNVRRFLSAARGVARAKPVIVVKSGPDAAVHDAAFRRAGILRVDTIPDLFSMSEVLATQPAPRGPTLGIVTNTLGPAMMARDAFRSAEVIDVAASATPEDYRAAVADALREPRLHGLLVLLAPRTFTDPTATARALAAFARVGKPLLACWLGGERVAAGRDILNTAGVPTFDAPEVAVRAFRSLLAYRQTQEMLYEKPEAMPLDGPPIRTGDPLRTHDLGPTGESGGLELTLGCHVDAQFGPVIHFGAGGLVGTAVGDRAVGLPPLNRTLARQLIERTRVAAVLSHPSVERLETLLTRLSRMLVDRTDILSVDIPLFVEGDEVRVGAGVVQLASGPVLPGLVLQPYPNQYTAPYRLRDGREVVVRAIRPEDEDLIVGLHNTTSEHAIRMRFFSMVKTLTRDRLIRLCHLDYDREMALAAVLTEASGARFCGVARYYLDPEANEAEFALLVGDAFQRQGLGQHLLERLVAVARERGIGKLVGDVLAENAPMLALVTQLGFVATPSDEASVVRVEVLLAG